MVAACILKQRGCSSSTRLNNMMNDQHASIAMVGPSCSLPLGRRKPTEKRAVSDGRLLMSAPTADRSVSMDVYRPIVRHVGLGSTGRGRPRTSPFDYRTSLALGPVSGVGRLQSSSDRSRATNRTSRAASGQWSVVSGRHHPRPAPNRFV